MQRPPLPPGMGYTAVDAYFDHTIALRSDGAAIAMGSNARGQATIAPLPPGTRYTAVSVSEYSTALLRSDGQILVSSAAGSPQLAVPPLPAGLRYVAVALSKFDAAAIRSDGSAASWGSNQGIGDYAIPPLPPGVSYVEVEGGYWQLLLRRSDGQVVSLGSTVYHRECRVPPLDSGTSYTAIGAGINRSVALVGTESFYTTFAAGCAGSRRATRLVPRDTPRLARTLEVVLLDLPANNAFVWFGWSRTSFGSLPLPIALGPLGMIGCSAYVSPDAVVMVAGNGGEAVLSIPIPNRAALLGASFYNQALVPDPGVNALGAVVSDAASGRIGD